MLGMRLANREWPREEPKVNRGSENKPKLTADVRRKYVRVKDVGADGNVRFDFAIGWPDLSVELVLPKAAFEEFCSRNDVQQMSASDNDSLSAREGD